MPLCVCVFFCARDPTVRKAVATVAAETVWRGVGYEDADLGGVISPGQLENLVQGVRHRLRSVPSPCSAAYVQPTCRVDRQP